MNRNILVRLVDRADRHMTETDQALNLRQLGVGGDDGAAGFPESSDRFDHLGLGFGTHDGREIHIPPALNHGGYEVSRLGDGIVHRAFRRVQVVNNRPHHFQLVH
ncbi:hypothetical protein [Brevundimonas sp.]|uniref:hypothetical protein n=1 Tax=Brevundimonas sp. TaxID=1871086 RepID=UPI002D1FBF26|nr:hypothetical protein [Brevundimonas sp.]